MSPKRLVKLVVVVVGSGQNKIHLWDFDHWTKVRLRRDKSPGVIALRIFTFAMIISSSDSSNPKHRLRLR